MASQTVLLKARGLYTFPNLLSELPKGSLVQADNVIINRDSVIEPRRGFKIYGNSFGTSSDTINQFLLYKDRLLRHFNSTLQFDNGSGTFTSFTGSFSEIDTGLRIKGQEANGNLYFTASTGIKKISSDSTTGPVAGDITDSGMYKALDVKLALDNTPGFLLNGDSVAYRIVWGITDKNQNLVLGAPSANTIIYNTSGSSSTVELTITIPEGITTSHFFQIYRTENTTGALPGDECKLAYEANPTSGEITAGEIIIEDITPESFLGANLYTNPNSGDGILQANDIPPKAKDIALYKNHLFFANTETRHRLNLALLGVDEFVSTTSTFTITDGTTTNTYTYRDSGDGGEDAATQKVLISGLSTIEERVDETARSLVHVINRNPNELVYAYYLSGPTDVPGLILLESRELGGNPFYLNIGTASESDQYSPQIPTSGTDVISDNEVSPNRVYYSKRQQPDAVPIVNFFDVGPKDREILRILALRESLFIFKEEGIYRLSGESAPFIVALFDSSTLLTAVDTAAVLNNNIFLLSDQGVAQVNDSGVSILSRPIEGDLIKLNLPTYTAYSTASFGVSYESDRSYYLWTVSETTDTVATQCYRYNTFTNSWTRYTISKTCGIISTADDKMYLGAADTNFIEQERKNFDRTDYADREFDFTLSVGQVSGTLIDVSSTENIRTRDVMIQIQYLTIAQYNRLLMKLDNDAGVADIDYFSSLGASAGDNLRDKLTSLAQKLDLDASVTDTDYESTISGYGATFQDTQDAFNDIVDKLNLDSGVFFSNYKQSSGTTPYEIIITDTDANSLTITTEYAYPFIAGPYTIYRHIDCNVRWAPETIQDPSVLKQISEATLITEKTSFSEVTLGFASDLDLGFEEITHEGNGIGIFGSGIYGENIYGGDGNNIPFRTLIPRGKQRCRYLHVTFNHGTARELFSIFGLSLTTSQISNRAYR